MDYADARSEYDAALESLLVQVGAFDELFPPRNTALRLRRPALNHRRLREARSGLEHAVDSFSEAVGRFTKAALAQCPDILSVTTQEQRINSDSLDQIA